MTPCKVFAPQGQKLLHCSLRFKLGFTLISKVHFYANKSQIQLIIN